MGARSGSELVKLRKHAKQLADERGERLSTVHLLAAVWHAGGPARGLLDERKLDGPSILRAARTFDEHDGDALADALAGAREIAHRSGVPSQASFPSSRRGAARPAAAAEPAGIHVLMVLLSSRRTAAYRALAQCGVDIARLRGAVTRIALGMVAPPRPGRPKDDLGQARRDASRAAKKALVEPAAKPERPSAPIRRSTRPARGRAVQVPLIPALRPPTPRAEDQPPDSAVFRLELESRGGELDLDRERFPVLAELGHNLTAEAARGAIDEVIGREREIEQVLDILAKRHANNALLVGPAGVGKTSIARGLARAFAASRDRLLVELPIAELLAGTSARGALAERMTAIREEVKGSERRVVLFIDEFHELLSSGSADEVMSELKVALARGELPLVAATSTEDHRRYIESDAALSRRFSVVEVEEPTEADAFLLLRAVAANLSRHHGVGYSDEAVASSVAWSKRYLTGRALPDKAVAILDLAGARLARRGEGGEVAPRMVAEIVSELAEVPLDRLLETDRERMLALDRLLEERIVGHDDACRRIAAVLRRNAAGLRGRRPIGTFLLLGPTGVGKTETAKAIAEVLFHSPDAMTRLDMSEYAEPHAVARLIGAPPGYVGHEAGGLLTEAVRKRPYQVVLLDEIEKAHRDVLQSFLQVFDEGRLTDGRGRTVDFTSTVLILTSNLGARELSAAVRERPVGFGARGPGRRDLSEVAVRAARDALPPELYNRIDEVVFFRHLAEADVRAIARRLLEQLAASLAERGVELDIDDSAIDALMQHGGFDAQLGARPMRRAIARLIEAPLADMILRGELEEGSVALLSATDGELVVDAVGGRRSLAPVAC